MNFTNNQLHEIAVAYAQARLTRLTDEQAKQIKGRFLNQFAVFYREALGNFGMVLEDIENSDR